MVAVAQAKSKMNSAMADINKSLEGTAKKDNPSVVGCANKRESDQRRKDREREYELKKKERAERKKMLSSQWQSHRKQNEDKPEKKSLWG